MYSWSYSTDLLILLKPGTTPLILLKNNINDNNNNNNNDNNNNNNDNYCYNYYYKHY